MSKTKFVWKPKDVGVTDPQCYFCKHFNRDNPGAVACDAFPNGIPARILTNLHDHHEPYSGDGGIRFEPMEGKAIE